MITDKIPPFTITEKALEEIRTILSQKNIPEGYFLRVGIDGGGCTGVSFVIGFDTLKQGDHVFTYNGITIYSAKKHAMFLIGAQIDFVDTIEERGFVFEKL